VRPLLFDAFPALAEVVPWLPLAHVPTPVDSCTAIESWLDRGGVFMKRDDLVSPLYGGNKVRRYEFLLADARRRGATRIVTAGGLASTQAMATVLFGRELGFDVCVVLFDQPWTKFARESLLGFASSSAEIVHGGGYVMTAARTWAALRRSRGSYLVLPGAASPLANLGYIDAMLELASQVERGEAPKPDVIVLPTGSSGTLAALALGAAHLGWDTEIVGVRITTPIACNRFTVDRIVAQTDRFLARHEPRWRSMRGNVRYSLWGDALGKGYGFPTAESIDGARQVEKLIGAPGEVTYSGKALAALRSFGALPGNRDRTILLWNTLSSVRPRPEPHAAERLPPSLRRLLDRPCVA
jgi:D-cysteine desulfhydrase